MNYSFSFGFRCLIFLVVAAVPCHAEGEERSGAVVNVSIDFPKVMELVAKEDQEPGNGVKEESSDFSPSAIGQEKRRLRPGAYDKICGGWHCSGNCSVTGVDKSSGMETTTYRLCICQNGTVRRDVEGCKAEIKEDPTEPQHGVSSKNCFGCERPGKREKEDQLVELIEQILHN